MKRWLTMTGLHLAGVASILALSLSLALFPANAQTDRGTVTGVILDPAGSPIPNAGVVVINLATGGRFPTNATETGAYTLPSPTSPTSSASRNARPGTISLC